MFVVLLTYTKSLDVMDALRPSHLAFLDDYYAKGVFLASGRQNPVVGGVILAKGVSKEELAEIMKLDPFYTEQAATFEIIEFNPNKFAAGLQDYLA